MVPTQANRLIALNSPLGPDVLLLRAFSGQEALSRLFSFELDLLATDPEIKFEDIIGKRVSIRVILGDEEERYFNGFISRFMQAGSDTGLANYRATMVPWLWFLTRTADCRIFQNKKIPDIIQQIFKEMGFTDVKTMLKGTYEPRDYCVQYRETDFNFVSRLMEQYGIFYYFEHEEKKHTLVLADDLSAHQPCPKQPSVKWNPHGSDALAEDVITSLQCEQSFRSGKYAVTDYNFETPSTSLMAEVKTKLEVGGNGKFEIYDFPGEYGKKGDGDKIAKIRMEEEEAQHLVIIGASTCRVFTPGYRFTLQDYVRKDLDGEYVLTQVQHFGSVGNTYTTTAKGEAGEGDYTNSFTCIPYKVPYRPPQVTPKPMVQGPQTAVVVGKAGEEIWTDKYGRVKVQFHWDRYGKKNEDSSCWMRVSQNWAGKQWGAMFLPRIGQEVIVEFIEGDPDQPIITGRVYNAEQTVPYALPAEQTKSTIKSNSSKGGGGSNELRFEDKKGSEEVYLHGQKDWTIAIENDKNQTVEHDETLSVGSNKTIKIGANHTETIGADMSLTVGGNQSISVNRNKTELIMINAAETVGVAKELTVGGLLQITVGGAMNETVAGAKAEEVGAFKGETVGGNKSEAIGGNRSLTAGGDINETIGKNRKVKIGQDLTETVSGKHTETVSKEYGVNAKKIQFAAEDELVLKAGDAQIILKKNGDIEIKGKKIQVKGSGDVIIKGSSIKQN